MATARHLYGIMAEALQRRLGLPLSCMRGIEYSQQLGREVDQLGDTFLTFHNHSKRHNGVVGVLARVRRGRSSTPRRRCADRDRDSISHYPLRARTRRNG